jgi:hypothetical protein
MEVWKKINDFPDYFISNLGNVKSLKKGKEKILKGGTNKDGYIYFILSYKNIQTTKTAHQLVAQSFLNHNPCGNKIVVNHINFIRTDNRLENLEIVTNRENTNKKHIKSRSKYIGVGWNVNSKKWISRIYINGKRKHLGCFVSEKEASDAYQKELSMLKFPLL